MQIVGRCGRSMLATARKAECLLSFSMAPKLDFPQSANIAPSLKAVYGVGGGHPVELGSRLILGC